jgi:hypothetical protein
MQKPIILVNIASVSSVSFMIGVKVTISLHDNIKSMTLKVLLNNLSFGIIRGARNGPVSSPDPDHE